MKLLIKLALFVVILVFSETTFAGTYIATGAEIYQVFNTNGNTSSFGIVIKGGSGPCANKQITFPVSAAGDQNNGSSDMLNRGYSTALTALSTGMKVDIYNYKNDDCENATFIKIKK